MTKFKVGDIVNCGYGYNFEVVGCHENNYYWVSKCGKIMPYHSIDYGSVLEYGGSMTLAETSKKVFYIVWNTQEADIPEVYKSSEEAISRLATNPDLSVMVVNLNET